MNLIIIVYLLFLIYINDFASVSNKLYYVLFADDTNIFISRNNLRKLINTLDIELDKLYAWLQSNKLTLNLLKTHYMVFHRAKHKHMDVFFLCFFSLFFLVSSIHILVNLLYKKNITFIMTYKHSYT